MDWFRWHTFFEKISEIIEGIIKTFWEIIIKIIIGCFKLVIDDKKVQIILNCLEKEIINQIDDR